MDEYEKNLVIEELLKTIARLKMENAGITFDNRQLKEDVESLRNEVARLETLAAGKDTPKAS